MKNLQVNNAKDLYDLTEKFREVGTKDYRYRCHYDLIRENMKEGYVHKELGTYYGWSAAYAALHGATKLHLVDVDFKPFIIFMKKKMAICGCVPPLACTNGILIRAYLQDIGVVEKENFIFHQMIFDIYILIKTHNLTGWHLVKMV